MTEKLVRGSVAQGKTTFFLAAVRATLLILNRVRILSFMVTEEQEVKTLRVSV